LSLPPEEGAADQSADTSDKAMQNGSAQINTKQASA